MKKRFSGSQIVAKLRQADVLLGQGKAVPEVCKDISLLKRNFLTVQGDFYKIIGVVWRKICILTM